MFAGHLGAGLLLKRAGREVSLGALFFSAMFLDIVLWLLVLAGVESVHVPANLRTMSGLTFDFPYSHGLAASAGWSAAVFVVGCRIWRRRAPQRRLAGALVLAAAVFSHFALDWLVHVPELPVAGRRSKLLGLGWWQNLPLAWSVETALVAVGLWTYSKTLRLPRGRLLALAAVLSGVTTMTILGQASKSAPPDPAVMAATSLLTIALLVWFGWWVERAGEKRPA